MIQFCYCTCALKTLCGSKWIQQPVNQYKIGTHFFRQQFPKLWPRADNRISHCCYIHCTITFQARNENVQLVFLFRNNFSVFFRCWYCCGCICQMIDLCIEYIQDKVEPVFIVQWFSICACKINWKLEDWTKIDCYIAIEYYYVLAKRLPLHKNSYTHTHTD